MVAKVAWRPQMDWNLAWSVDVTFWWTPTCGYLHVETNPLTIPFECPEGVKPSKRRRAR